MLSIGICLGICAVWDWKKRELPVWILLFFQLITIGLVILDSEKNVLSRVEAVGIGLIFLGISILTKQAIGYADSWIILILGSYLGLERLLVLLLIASFLAAVVSLGVLLFGRWKQKDTIPYIPFLAIGYIGMHLL